MVSTKVVAPGTSGGKVSGDRTAPAARVRFTRRQDIDKLRVRARMSEPGTITARAIIDTGGLLARIYNFRPARRKVKGGVLTTLQPRLSAKNKRALKRALRKGKKLRARVTVTATDLSGNVTTIHATIRLKP